MAGIDERKIFVPINIGVLTVTDSRTLETDTSGKLLADRLTGANVDVIITNGGTGLTGRDVTPEAFAQVCEKEIPGFGELFRWVSIKSIGTSTVQSRATAGVARGTYLFALPGSNGAVKDGWDEILKFQLDSRHGPCNFVELIPRLREK
jgi:molybdopterin adenylyltransferase